MLSAHRPESWTLRVAAKAIFAGLCLLGLQGCIARTVASVVTAPVRIAGKAVDLATTSQSEADEKRGRDLRLQEQRLGQLERSYRQHVRQCEQGNDTACNRAEGERTELERFAPGSSASFD